MRRVLKRETEPESFAAWKSLSCDDWEPSYSVLQNPEKKALHLALLEDQGGTCCYCGRDIALENSHIEHFRPQNEYLWLSLSYPNLFASCIREIDPGSPLCCGHLKGDWFEEKYCLSPVDASCEEQYRYALDGQIIATTEAATVMQSVLGLNGEFLVNRRQSALVGVFDEDFVQSMTHSELTTISIKFRERSASGNHFSFFHVIARYAEQLLADERPTV